MNSELTRTITCFRSIIVDVSRMLDDYFDQHLIGNENDCAIQMKACILMSRMGVLYQLGKIHPKSSLFRTNIQQSKDLN
jgi:hypothetical protein